MTKLCSICSNTVHARGLCKKCYMTKYRIKNRNQLHEYNQNSRIKRGIMPMHLNKQCSDYLGLHVAVNMLSKLFKDVERMPNNNIGYDFICNKGKKIDVKSSTFRTTGKGYTGWVFTIRKNKIADYFLCLAFDNRDDLNPQHMWLIPSSELNHLYGTSITQSTIHKWDEYKHDVDKVIECCDTIKNETTPTPHTS